MGVWEYGSMGVWALSHFANIKFHTRDGCAQAQLHPSSRGASQKGNASLVFDGTADCSIKIPHNSKSKKGQATPNG
jgi:hypothetical protein